MMFAELAIVAALIVLNGLLAMSELAIVSARPARLKMLIEQRVTGSHRALALASDPGRFLSTVQIGITLVGILAGAYSGATLGRRLVGLADRDGASASRPPTISASALVVTVITYFSLIVGELVPKQIALRDPERIACKVAPAMTCAGAHRRTRGVAAVVLRQSRALAVRRRRPGAEPRHRGGDQDPGGGSRGRGRARAAGARDDQRGAPPRRPAGARRDDAAPRGRHDRHRRRCRDDPPPHGGEQAHAAAGL